MFLLLSQGIPSCESSTHFWKPRDMRKCCTRLLLHAHISRLLCRFPSKTKAHQSPALGVMKYLTMTANICIWLLLLPRGVCWPEQHLWNTAYGCISFLRNTGSDGFLSQTVWVESCTTCVTGWKYIHRWSQFTETKHTFMYADDTPGQTMKKPATYNPENMVYHLQICILYLNL